MSARISRRRLLVTTAISTSVGLVGCLETTDDESTDWPTRGYDAGNSGYAPNARGPTDDAEVAWTADLNASRAGSPIVYDGRIYVGTNRGMQSKFPQGHVVALDRDGDEQWRYLAERAINRPLTATADGIYGGTRGGMVVALDHEGERRWRYDLGSENSADVKATSDRVYATSWEAGLTALDTAGNRLWQYQAGTTPGIRGIPTVGEESVYVGVSNLYALDQEGTLRWTYENEGYQITPPALHDDILYLVEYPTQENEDKTEQTYVIALDFDGTEQWRTRLSGAGGRRIAGDTLLVSADPGVVALNAATGEELWRYTRSRSLSPSIAGDVAYLVTDTDVHAVDVSSGDRLWKEDDIIAANMPAVSKGTVYIGSADGKLHALEEPGMSLPFSIR